MDLLAEKCSDINTKDLPIGAFFYFKTRISWEIEVMKVKATTLLTERKFSVKLVPWFKYIQYIEGV